MQEEPAFMVHSQRWQDEMWNYEDACPHGKGLDCHDCHAAAYILAMSARVSAETLPHKRHDLAWWLALLLVAGGAVLTIVAAAFLCQIIGL